VTSRSGSAGGTGSAQAQRPRVRSVQRARSSPGRETIVRPETVDDEAAETEVILPERVPPDGARPDRVPGGNAREATDRPSDLSGDRSDWCAIVFAETEHGAEFQVVVVQRAGPRRVVSSSPTFRTPLSRVLLPGRRIPHRGRPRRAHDTLVKQLLASGWWQLQTRGRWHDTAFVRSRSDPKRPPPQRLLIGFERDGRAARFCAEELDRFGHGTPVARSRPFPVNPWDFGLRKTTEATAAHEELLTHLCSSGWASTSEPCREWYALVLQRTRATRRAAAGSRRQGRARAR
jgi:hypothetical protein